MDNIFLEGFGAQTGSVNVDDILNQPISKDIFGRGVLFENCDYSPAIADVCFNEAVTQTNNMNKAAILLNYKAKVDNNENLLTEGMGGVIESIKNMFKKLFETVKAFFSRIWMKVESVFSSRTEFVKKNTSKIMQGANYSNKDGDETKLNWVGAKVVAYIGAAKTNMDTVIGAFDKIVDDAKYKTKEIPDFAKIDVSAWLSLVEKITADGDETNSTKAFDKDGKPVVLKAAAKVALATDSATSAGTSKVISDAKSDISDAVSTVLEDTNELKVSEKISDAVKYYEKTDYKAVADLIKQATKDIDKAAKDAGKFKITTAMTAVHTNGLQIAFTLASFQNYLLQKHVAINKHYADVCWAFIQKAASQYSAVTKQRNLGESTNLSNGSDILSKFGY